MAETDQSASARRGDFDPSPVAETSSLVRLALPSVAAAALLAVLVTVLGGATFPGYSHLSQYISELGARDAPFEHLVRFGGFLPTGLLLCVFALAAARALPRSPLTTIGLVGVVAFAMGYVVAAFMPCDPGCRPEEPSVPQVVHNLAGLTGYLAAPVALTMLAVSSRRWRGGDVLFASGIVAALLALAGLATLSPESPYAGLSQRILEASVFTWLVACGVVIHRHHPGCASRRAVSVSNGDRR